MDYSAQLFHVLQALSGTEQSALVRLPATVQLVLSGTVFVVSPTLHLVQLALLGMARTVYR